MYTGHLRILVAAAMLLLSWTAGRPATVSVNSAVIDNVGLNEPFFRFGDNLIFDQTGMCMKGFVNVSVEGFAGKRLFCMVEPIVNGSTMADRSGSCNAVYAFAPSSSSYSGNVAFALPYQWAGLSMNSKVNDDLDLKIQVKILDMTSDNPVLAEKIIAIDNTNTQVDPNRVATDGLGSMLGALFGGGDGSITCTSCDGTGLCPFCDGDGFIDPSMCRKCSAHPGICRRCHGKGEEEVEIRESGGWIF